MSSGGWDTILQSESPPVYVSDVAYQFKHHYHNHYYRRRQPSVYEYPVVLLVHGHNNRPVLPYFMHRFYYA